LRVTGLQVMDLQVMDLRVAGLRVAGLPAPARLWDRATLRHPANL